LAPKRVLCKEADGGTLSLDEISETSPGMQVKLLRAIQEGEAKPVGGEQSINVDVRIVAATNQDLTQAMAAGRFRPDLYYRLNVIGVHLPELKERREDILLLAEHFLEMYRKRLKRDVREIAPEALALLMDYDWPGNVRELENCIERAVVLVRGEAIRPEHLPGNLRQLTSERSLTFAVGTSMEGIERQALLATMREVNENKAAASRLLGISQRTLYRKIKAYGLNNLLPDKKSQLNSPPDIVAPFSSFSPRAPRSVGPRPPPAPANANSPFHSCQVQRIRPTPYAPTISSGAYAGPVAQ